MRHGTIFITVEITHFVRIAIFPAPLSIKHQYIYIILINCDCTVCTQKMKHQNNDYKENVLI